MKKFLSIVLGIVLLLALCFSGCSKPAEDKIVLKEYPYSFEIHTELQADYLGFMFNASYVPDSSDEVRGVAELSRPLPVTLEWTGSADEYLVEISENSDMSAAWKFVAKQCKLDVYNLKIATKYYWRVSENVSDGFQSKVGTFSVSDEGPRNLFVDGVTNVRDLGGWVTSTGHIKQGMLFRGARLNQSYATGKEDSRIEPDVLIPEITAEGCKVFGELLGIKTEVDFRLDARNGYPEGVALNSVVPGVTYVALPMNGNASTGDNATQIKALMELLADQSNYPVYVHCNIGTDRTGMVCYLIGALCGMSEEDLLKDYLFSNFGNIGEVKSLGSSKNAFIGLADFEGATIQQRAESYFQSIGVTAQVYEAVRNILTEK